MRTTGLVSPLLLALGCVGPSTHVTHDLAELLPQAVITRETDALDFGTDPARLHLLEGWSRDEGAEDGTRFVWGLGSASTLSLHAAGGRRIGLRFRCWPFAYPGSPPQSVRVFVNGHDLGSVRLAPEPAEYRLVIPAEVLTCGENLLELRYDHARAPREVLPGSTDIRPLAVGWDWLGLETGEPRPAPSVTGEGGGRTLQLPWGSRVEYHVTASRGTALVVDGARLSEPTGPVGAVCVELQTLGSTIEERFDLGSSLRQIEVPLPVNERMALVRVALRACPGVGTGQAPGGVSLVRPTIRSPGPKSADPPPTPGRPGSARRPNLIVYLIDTLRADHLGCYGYDEAASPRIDAFARTATLFSNAYASSSWTKSSVGSILTGLHPGTHGANQRDHALPARVVTLAERLRDQGYETAGFVTNPNLAPAFGFDQGFDTYELLAESDPQRAYVRSDDLNRRALTWLDGRETERPFFLYLHSMDPHDPYLAGSDAGTPEAGGLRLGSMAFMKALEQGRLVVGEEERAKLTSLYDAEIEANDASFGELLDSLEAASLFGPSLIVLLSDHGEEFHDHGWWRHGKTLYEEQLRVPLVVKWPGAGTVGERVTEVVQLVDLVPTLIDYLGLWSDTEEGGRSLLPLLRSSPWAERPVMGHLDLDGRQLESVIAGRMKLIRTLAYDRASPSLLLLDLSRDPGESRNLAGEQAVAVEFLSSLLRRSRALAAATPSPSRVTIDESLESQLRALGYVQ